MKVTVQKKQLEGVVREYGRMVSAIAYRMAQDEFLAQDIAQEIWIQVMQGLESFRGDAKLSTWIYTIAYRTAMKYSQKEKRYTTTFLHDYFRRAEEISQL